MRVVRSVEEKDITTNELFANINDWFIFIDAKILVVKGNSGDWFGVVLDTLETSSHYIWGDDHGLCVWIDEKLEEDPNSVHVFETTHELVKFYLMM